MMSILKNSLKKIPILRDMLKESEIQNFLKQKYHNEMLLLQGKHKTNSLNPSIVSFTVHRCASQLMVKIFRIIERNTDMTRIHLEGYFWSGGQLDGRPQEIYKKFGYLYGPFYGMDKEEYTLPIPNLDNFKVFLMLRDPRDVLTSYYFYHAFSSYDDPKQQEFLMARNKETQSKVIDEWVLEKAPIFKARYEEYCDKLYGRPNVLFLKYEDMIADFDSWFSRFMEFSGFNLSDEVIEAIHKEANFNVKNEDQKAHKRQVTPGDHKRKLKEETIGVLNSQFQRVLGALNYEI